MKQKIPVGILPVAKKWHFAGDWGHLWKNDIRYSKSYKRMWSNSKNLLDRTISIPISIKSSKKMILRNVEKI